jgi:hypothetical protein
MSWGTRESEAFGAIGPPRGTSRLPSLVGITNNQVSPRCVRLLLTAVPSSYSTLGLVGAVLGSPNGVPFPRASSVEHGRTQNYEVESAPAFQTVAWALSFGAPHNLAGSRFESDVQHDLCQPASPNASNRAEYIFALFRSI